jgi:hypothetical protein
MNDVLKWMQQPVATRSKINDWLIGCLMDFYLLIFYLGFRYFISWAIWPSWDEWMTQSFFLKYCSMVEHLRGCTTFAVLNLLIRCQKYFIITGKGFQPHIELTLCTGSELLGKNSSFCE